MNPYLASCCPTGAFSPFNSFSPFNPMSTIPAPGFSPWGAPGLTSGFTTGFNPGLTPSLVSPFVSNPWSSNFGVNSPLSSTPWGGPIGAWNTPWINALSALSGFGSFGGPVSTNTFCGPTGIPTTPFQTPGYVPGVNPGARFGGSPAGVPVSGVNTNGYSTINPSSFVNPFVAPNFNGSINPFGTTPWGWNTPVNGLTSGLTPWNTIPSSFYNPMFNSFVNPFAMPLVNPMNGLTAPIFGSPISPIFTPGFVPSFVQVPSINPMTGVVPTNVVPTGVVNPTLCREAA